ncbi:MAG: acetate--CoA ligase family protein [Caulobacterales bacterium]|uniref:acetate--CoA ligase family protein n=1 Tax=Glycocaulis sp. TaxID=1969725 RepID=UPI003FA159AD
MANDALTTPAAAVARLLAPRSVALVGISENAGSMGLRSLDNLERFAFGGDIHLVSRSNETVRGRPCLPDIDALPEGVDAAILALPRQGVVEAVRACARRGVGACVIYAAGFAEAGEEGLAEQAAMAAIAREAGMAVLGPNTLGLSNYVDGVALAFGPNGPNPPAGRKALAVIAQSGAMMGTARMSMAQRGVAISHAVATGNEAVTGVEDIMDHLVELDSVTALAVFAEQLRQPRRFLELAARARLAGKPVILLHPGRSEAAQASAASHTGALTGDHAVMRAMTASEAVINVETLEEFLDTAELLTRFPHPSALGPAIITDSGAVRGLALDMAEALDLPLPELAPATVETLNARLPDFATATNPLDITAQGLKDMPLYAQAAAALAGDENCGSVLVAAMPGAPDVGLAKASAILPELAASGRPAAYVVLGDAPIAPGLPDMVRDQGFAFLRSPERALRALAHAGRYRQLKDRAAIARDTELAGMQAPSGQGALPETEGKALLRAAGLAVPDGGLARSVDEALNLAGRIGFPVVLKVVSAAIAHKSDVGGVAVGLKDAAALQQAWQDMQDRIAANCPGIEPEGYLVETMVRPGLEMVVGARRDPHWGPVVMAGLGGVWIEALKDVRLMPADMPASLVEAELRSLKAAALLDEFRGRAAIDVEALALAVTKIGALMRACPSIVEIDVNPLVAYPAGQEPLALDALVILREG